MALPKTWAVASYLLFSVICVNGFDPAFVTNYIETSWNNDMLSALSKFIEVPNQSPDFDPQWNSNGLQEQAVAVLEEWVNAQNVVGLTLDVIKADDRTPLIFIEIEANNVALKDTTVLLYGHFDKQPPLTADWDPGLGPYTPVVKDGKLYGRGGADDGYSIFAAITAVKVAQAQNDPHPRIVIMIEGSEESGSNDLFHYFEQLLDRIQIPQVVMVLDSGAKNWEQIWTTVSLRGVVVINLKCQLLSSGVHSGNSGLVRDSFHVLRLIMSRIDNAETAEMCEALQVEIPETHINYAKANAAVLGSLVYSELPFYNSEGRPQIPEVVTDPSRLYELLLENTWKPQLAIIGMDGMPDLAGGNVLRPFTTAKLSIRTPPTLNEQEAEKAVKAKLEQKPTPWGANVEATNVMALPGFVSPEFESWLADSMEQASVQYFGPGKSAQFFGEGGTIPFLNPFQQTFPQAQFVVLGVLGPGTNEHGPNEGLNISYTKQIMASVSQMLYDIGQNYINNPPSTQATQAPSTQMVSTNKMYKEKSKKKSKNNAIFPGHEQSDLNDLFNDKSDGSIAHIKVTLDTKTITHILIVLFIVLVLFIALCVCMNVSKKS